MPRIFALIVAASTMAIIGGDLGSQGVRSDTIVRMATTPRYPGVATLQEEVSIGAENKGPEYIFSSITSILAARDGSVWVLNGGGILMTALGTGGETSLRRYDATGKFLKTIAVRGSGPGEFNSPSSLAQLPDGRVLLRENQPSPEKILVFSELGLPLEPWIFPRVDSTTRTTTWMVADTGGMTYTQILQRSTDPQSGGASVPLRTMVARLDISGKLIDVIPPPDFGDAITRSMADTRPTAFSPAARVAWSPRGYFVTAISSRYAIDLRIPVAVTSGRSSASGRAATSGVVPPVWKNGDPVVSIRRNVTPVAISAVERRERDAFTESQAARSGGSRARGAAPTTAPTPATKPPIRSISVATDGRVWVMVAMPSERYVPPATMDRSGNPIPVLGWREPNVYDVFEADGTYVVRVALSADSFISQMKGNTVWGFTRDENNVPTVKRWRITGW